jgi:SH3 domain-containing YSC84-like protein 1
MRRFVLAAIALAVSLGPGVARAQGVEQTIVDRATLALQEMMTQTVSQDPRHMLEHARGAMICPRVFKAGFFFGGSGGDCILVARAGNGTWSYPSFYGIGSGSFGFQFGIEDSALLMLIMTQRGLNAVMDSQFKLGADASIAIATIGGSVGGATTAAVGADILVYAETRGLFGGVSVEGSIMSLRSDMNQAYYGQTNSARQVVIQMVAANPGADPLRGVLTRYGTPVAMPVNAPPPPPPPMGGPMPTGPGYAPAYPQAEQGYGAPPPGNGGPYGQPVPLQPNANAQVQQQSLPPPSR